MNRTIPTTIFAASLLSLACAHDPSKELVNARQTYETAANGPAAATAKTEVYDAKKALARAEKAHDRKSGSEEEIDLAYVAMRKADYAIAYSTYLQYQSNTEKAKAEYLTTLESQKNNAQDQLADTKEELEAKEKALMAAQSARKALELQLVSALGSLSEMAKIKQEEQRTVITLNGAVLFKSDETQLLPIAKEKLGQVADVLKQYGDEYSITVNGYTDSRGSDVHNQQLSQGRAESVRAFLVSRGVAEGVVSAIGQGEAQPVADNKSAEGRANNRRVEIVVDRIGTPEAK